MPVTITPYHERNNDKGEADYEMFDNAERYKSKKANKYIEPLSFSFIFMRTNFINSGHRYLKSSFK